MTTVAIREGPENGRAAAGAIDWAQVRAILRATLRMRLRFGREMGADRSGKPHGLIAILILYTVFGFLIGWTAFAHPDVFTFAVVIQAATLLMAGSVVVAESSQILFNPREADLLGHRPIGARTLLTAKMLDVTALTVVVSLVLNLGPMILGGFGLSGSPRGFPLAHLLGTSVAAIFTAGAMVFCYAALMTLVGRDRLDGLLAWWQVVISVLLVLGYQLIPRMLDRIKGFHLDPAFPGLFLLPPAWFAAMEALLAGAAPSGLLVGMAAAGVVVTAVLPVLAVGKLAADYASGFAALGETPAPSDRAQERRVRAAGRMHPILRAWMKDPVERGVFGLSSVAMRRDRDVRMRLYPTIGTSLVFAVLPLVDPDFSAGPIMSLVFLGMLTTSAMETLRVSPQHAAAEVFRYAPLEGTAAVFHGARKAVLVGYVFPVLVLLLPVFLFAIRDRQTLLIMAPVFLAIPTLSLLGGLSGSYLPLSVAPTVGRQSLNQIGAMIGGVLISGLITGLAFAALHFGWFLPMLAAELILLAVAHAFLLRRIRARRLDPIE